MIRLDHPKLNVTIQPAQELPVAAISDWRFGERWRLDFEYFGANNDGPGITDAEIRFGDIVIPLGIAAKAEIDTDIFALGVG